MHIKGRNILITSNEPWGDIWYSKHNVAWELSRNNQVIFVNPPGRWKVSGLFGSAIRTTPVSDSLHILNYRNRLPFRFYRLNNLLVSKSIKRKLSKIHHLENLLLWSFDPYRLTNPGALGATTTIFHAVDKYKLTHPGEFELLTHANGVVSVSREIADVFSAFNIPSLVVSHGISADEFDVNSNSAPADLKSLPTGYFLYVGGIDYRLDALFLKKMVDRFPDQHFVFIGKPKIHPIKGDVIGELLKGCKNVHFAGPRPFKQLKYYIHHAKACLAPMEQGIDGNTISHHKIFQYLALGKAVFSPVFSEYKGFSRLLYMENDHFELLDRMEEFIQHVEDQSLKEERIAYAREHSFEQLLLKIGTFIHEIEHE